MRIARDRDETWSHRRVLHLGRTEPGSSFFAMPSDVIARIAHMAGIVTRKFPHEKLIVSDVFMCSAARNRGLHEPMQWLAENAKRNLTIVGVGCLSWANGSCRRSRTAGTGVASSRPYSRPACAAKGAAPQCPGLCAQRSLWAAVPAASWQLGRVACSLSIYRAHRDSPNETAIMAL
jgi:hypothetical protein